MLKEQLFLIDLIVTMLILEQLLNSLHRLNHLAKFKCFNVAFRGRYVRFKRIVLFSCIFTSFTRVCSSINLVIYTCVIALLCLSCDCYQFTSRFYYTITSCLDLSIVTFCFIRVLSRFVFAPPDQRNICKFCPFSVFQIVY